MLRRQERLFVQFLLLTVAAVTTAFTPTATTTRQQLTSTTSRSAPFFQQQQQQRRIHSNNNGLYLLDPVSGANDFLTTATSLEIHHNNDAMLKALDSLLLSASDTSPPEAGGVSYSKASYYTVLGLYLISFPGLWSTIKRSTKAKIKRKTFVSKGENAAPYQVLNEETNVLETKEGRSLRQEAGEIMAYMKAKNYEVVDAGETITFRGIVPRSLSQAFFLTFCTALGLLSLALVLQIQFNSLVLPFGLGEPNWFLLALLSPYAGLYYWRSGDRVDELSVKLLANDKETENEVTVQGSEEELERMWRTLGWQEKGMVRVPGLLDQLQQQQQ